MKLNLNSANLSSKNTFALLQNCHNQMIAWPNVGIIKGDRNPPFHATFSYFKTCHSGHF